MRKQRIITIRNNLMSILQRARCNSVKSRISGKGDLALPPSKKKEIQDTPIPKRGDPKNVQTFMLLNVTMKCRI